MQKDNNGMNNKYRVGIIGAGMMACGYDNPQSETILTHAHAIITSKDFELAGIIDIDRNKANDEARRWNTKAFESLDDMEKECDVLCCVVPDDYYGIKPGK